MVSKIRKEQGITQARLAKEVGITRPYLSDIENSKNEISGRLMLKIANYLKTPVEEVFIVDDLIL